MIGYKVKIVFRPLCVLQCQCQSKSQVPDTHFHLGEKVLSVSKIVAMTTLVVQHSENYYYHHYHHHHHLLLLLLLLLLTPST